MLIKLLVIFLIFTQIGYAGDVTFIKKETPAPYDGYLFTPEKTEEVRRLKIEYDSEILLNQSLQRSLNLQNEIITKEREKTNLVLEQNDKLVKANRDSQTVNTFEKVGYFLLGAAAVFGGGYVFSKVAR